MDDLKMTKEQLEEKRIARRKRRQRNQILAYCVMLIFIAALAFGIVKIVHKMAETPVQQVSESQNQNQIKVDEIISSEEELVIAEPEPVVIELTPQQRLDEIVEAAIEVMPLEDKVAGLFIATPESITGVNTAVKAGEGTKVALDKYAVGGVIYNSKNIKDAEQFTEMLDNTRLYSKYPLFLAVEQEEGTSGSMIKGKLIETTETAKELAAQGDASVAMAAGTNMAEKLSAFGINLNLAPLADIGGKGDNTASRYFGSSAVLNGAYTSAYLAGMKQGGVLGCAKYFPGSGDAKKVGDSSMIDTEKTAEEFGEQDFAVYQTVIEGGAQMIMVGNYSASGLTGERIPCSLSSLIVTDLLRTQLGYQGVVLSDFMDQKAITEYYSADEAAIMALKAGCDMILCPENFEKAYNGVLEAVQTGTISEDRINDALKRVYRIKFADRIEGLDESNIEE